MTEFMSGLLAGVLIAIWVLGLAFIVNYNDTVSRSSLKETKELCESDLSRSENCVQVWIKEKLK